MPKRKTAAKTSRASSSPKKAHYAGSEKRLAVRSPELRKLISRKQKARWRRYFEEYPETPRKPRPAKLPHNEVHERRAASHRKPVVGISARTGERLRFDSLLAAAEFLFALGETSSVVAAQLIISQVCNGHRHSVFGYYRGLPSSRATNDARNAEWKMRREKTEKSRGDQKILKKYFWARSALERVEKLARAISPNKNGGKTHIADFEMAQKRVSPKSVRGYLRSSRHFW